MGCECPNRSLSCWHKKCENPQYGVGVGCAGCQYWVNGLPEGVGSEKHEV